jgi:nanoRNase/pAp phosphatase (c-di-AMP/oligoRNAs hydrolase)
MKITEMSRTRLRRLLKAFEGVERALILTHDYPDPDSIASALALKRLLEQRIPKLSVDIGHGGIVGRAENRELVRAVKAPLCPLSELDPDGYQQFALVDTQPRTGNNSLPAGKRPLVVLDHHPIRRETRRVKFHDIRTRFGATATMMYEYLKTARFRLDEDLATALFYGIRTETQSLTREASKADRDAYLALLPTVDFRRIYEIEYAGVSREYFEEMGSALSTTTLYGDVAFTWLGEISNPDFCAEFCDMILRLESTRWALCVGAREGLLYLSMRTRERQGHAGRKIARVVGKEGKAGGHGMMAGGIAWLDRFENGSAESALSVLCQRFLEVTDAKEREGEPLVPRRRRARPKAADVPEKVPAS